VTQDEVIRLVMQITGTKDIKAAGEELTKLKERMESVRNETEKTGKSFGSAGVQVGRFVQDASAGFGMGGLQGAILATSNNVEGLLMGLGLGGGIAGALTLIMALAPLVMNAMKGMFDGEPVQTFTNRVDELKVRIEELEKKPVKFTADTTELEKLRKEVDALTKAKQILDTLMGAQTLAEKESGQAVADALVNTPGGQEALAAARARAREAGVAGSAEVIGAQTSRTAAMQDVDFFTARAEAARDPGAMYAAQEALKGAKQRLADANKAASDAIDKAGNDAVDQFSRTVADAQQGKGLVQRDAQQRLGQALSDAGGAGPTVAGRIGLAGVGGSGVRAGGGAAIGAMNLQMAEVAKDNREAADLTAQGLANEEAFRRKEEKRSEEEARDNRKAREEGKRTTEEAARRFGSDNPRAALEAQGALMSMGNTPDAVLAVSQSLQANAGLAPDVANTFATGLSNELASKVAQALDVTGNRQLATQSVQLDLVRALDGLAQRFNQWESNQSELMRRRDGLFSNMQRMGRQ
jgi:hypothetical protein